MTKMIDSDNAYGLHSAMLSRIMLIIDKEWIPPLENLFAFPGRLDNFPEALWLAFLL